MNHPKAGKCKICSDYMIIDAPFLPNGLLPCGHKCFHYSCVRHCVSLYGCCPECSAKCTVHQVKNMSTIEADAAKVATAELSTKDKSARLAAEAAAAAVTAAANNIAELYVGDLDVDVGDNNVLVKFSAFGPVWAQVAYGANTRSLRYARIKFRTHADAAAALAALNSSPLCCKPMRLLWSTRDPNPSLAKVVVCNLVDGVCSSFLHQFFAQFGTIMFYKLKVGSDGKKRGYVIYETEAEANEAIAHSNEYELSGTKITVEPCKSRADMDFDYSLPVASA